MSVTLMARGDVFQAKVAAMTHEMLQHGNENTFFRASKDSGQPPDKLQRNTTRQTNP